MKKSRINLFALVSTAPSGRVTTALRARPAALPNLPSGSVIVVKKVS